MKTQIFEVLLIVEFMNIFYYHFYIYKMGS